MLINPYIEGSLPKVFQADNSIKAAKKAYETLSNYFNNSVHNFKFTLLKVKSDSVDEKKSQISNFNLEQYGGSPKNKRFNTDNFSHFVVNEVIDKNKDVSYSIKKYNGKIEHTDDLVQNIIKIQSKSKKSKRSGKSLDRLSESAKSESESESAQEGGHKKYDDDDDDDDSPDYYVKKSYYIDPISYWYYYPSLYSPDRLYLPTFVSPLSFPYVVDFYPSAFYSPDPSIGVFY